MNDDLWDKVREVGSVTWKGCDALSLFIQPLIGTWCKAGTQNTMGIFFNPSSSSHNLMHLSSNSDSLITFLSAPWPSGAERFDKRSTQDSMPRRVTPET